ncbi:hypothetical protein BJY01DRAFT_219543 [Aspergillus pseudoustus]|uniref:Nephrocystin 3-like N-terminal domain-containing protein n=1 Tax=Aspergillus pseudoustus TaxID=1810923 RepID=A0ABR4JG64_9EURO
MLVRSLIAQLARPGPSNGLRGEVIRAYDQLVQKEGDAAAAEGAGLLWNDATQLLLQLLDQGTATICIDALDECAEESRGLFLALIDHLLTRPDGGRVKILISSRPSLNIAHRFPSWACYSVDAGQNAGDIDAYARDRAARCLEEMRQRFDLVTPELEENLTQHLIHGAQGM